MTDMPSTQSDLKPLLARSWYTAVEWAYASEGRCFWYTGTYPGETWCGEPSSAGSAFRFCDTHDAEASTHPAYHR